jgi:hypothetical protein
MSDTALTNGYKNREDGYKNFEDGDECGFVSPKPTEEPSSPVHDIIQTASEDRHATMDSRQTLEERLILLNRGQRWVITRLDELLKQPLTRDAIGVLQEMRRAQASNVERCDALIASSSVNTPRVFAKTGASSIDTYR